MAKKKETKIDMEETPEVTETKVEETVVEKPVKKEKPKKDEWEIKPRTYLLMRNKKPLSKMIKSANVYYFDEEKGYERELKY